MGFKRQMLFSLHFNSSINPKTHSPTQ